MSLDYRKFDLKFCHEMGLPNLISLFLTNSIYVDAEKAVRFLK